MQFSYIEFLYYSTKLSFIDLAVLKIGPPFLNYSTFSIIKAQASSLLYKVPAISMGTSLICLESPLFDYIFI